MKKYLLMIAMLATTLCSLFVLSSCEDDSENGLSSVTASAEVESYHSAILNGFAYGANGKVGFCYSSTIADPTPDNSTCVETSTIKTDGSYSISIDGLKANTTYYYRAYATKDNIKIMAKEVMTFMTKEPEYVAVDLGLSVKWATCNVGADNPEDYGDYYAWGETETKSTYNWSTYKWMASGYSDWKHVNKYTYPDGQTSGIWYNNGTFVGDNKTTLDPEDDVAHVKWGGDWRMPTKAEQDELCDTNNCTWTWTTQGGKNGYKVTSKKNGNSIFLPAAGFRNDSSLSGAGSWGHYWSSSLGTNYSDGSYRLYFYSGDVYSYYNGRDYGQSVRPVCP